MTEPLRVLCVCTHNRTRSVLMGGLLQRHFAERDIDAIVSTAGLKPGGEPAMDRAVRLLADVGVDVGAHRSRGLSTDCISAADLVLTAERQHVVSIVGMWPTAFAHTFTLPEAAERVRAADTRGTRSVDEWLGGATAALRPTGLDYLDASTVGEVDDPTGQSPATWARVFAEIDEMTHTIAAGLW
ncbi:MAG: hypothetical protein ABIR32_17465 [Ilumatobacteraceae bacterium]